MSRRHGAHDAGADRLSAYMWQFVRLLRLGKVEPFSLRRSGHCVIRSAWALRSIFSAANG
jgi:hypothetical protein